MAMVLAGPAEGDTPITVTPAIAAAAAAVANLEMRRMTSPSQMRQAICRSMPAWTQIRLAAVYWQEQ